MADCIRVPGILLVMCLFSFAHQLRGDNADLERLALNPESIQNPGAGPGAGVNPGAVDKNQGAGASITRRRSTGWKLSDEAVCREDLTRRCPKHSWNNNLAVLECLQDKKEVNERWRKMQFETSSWVCLPRLRWIMRSDLSFWDNKLLVFIFFLTVTLHIGPFFFLDLFQPLIFQEVL
ncbi:hypothetical protein GOODEAATRI_027841 [Goodea atripinnis]|uniref:Uncharacterized protein n=1 Tax=Goodea atripinnis TaxID=208336 RepID=A0ABV0P8C6_9TELE